MLIIKQNEQQKTAHLNISINIPVGNDTIKNLQERVLNMSCQRKKGKKKLNDEFIAVPKPIKEEIDETSSIVLNQNICQDIKDVGAYVSFVNELEASENEISAEQLLNCSDTLSPLDTTCEANHLLHAAHNIIEHDIYKKLQYSVEYQNKGSADINHNGEMPPSDIYKLNKNTLNMTQTRLNGSLENIKDSYMNARNKTSNLEENKNQSLHEVIYPNTILSTAAATNNCEYSSEENSSDKQLNKHLTRNNIPCFSVYNEQQNTKNNGNRIFCASKKRNWQNSMLCNNQQSVTLSNKGESSRSTSSNTSFEQELDMERNDIEDINRYRTYNSTENMINLSVNKTLKVNNNVKHKFHGINLCEKASNPTEIIPECDSEYGESIFSKISDKQDNNNANVENTKQISDSNISSNNIQVAEVEPTKTNNSTFQLTAKTSDCGLRTWGKDMSVAYEDRKLVSDEMSSFVNKLAESSLQEGKTISNKICNEESTSNNFSTSNTDLREEPNSSLLTKVSSLKNNCVLISNSPIKTSNEKESTSTGANNFEETQQKSISSKNKSKSTVEKKIEFSKYIRSDRHEGSSGTICNDTVLKTLHKFRKLRAPGNTNTAEEQNNEFHQNKDELKCNKYNPEKNNPRTGDIYCNSNLEKIVDSKEKIVIGNIEPIGNDSNCSLKRNLSDCMDDTQYTNKKRNLKNLYSQASKRNKMLQVEELSHIEPHNSKNIKNGNKLKKPSIKQCDIKQYFAIMNTSSKLGKGKEKAEQNYSDVNSVSKIDDIPNIKLNESSFSVKKSSKQTKMNSHNSISLVKTYKHDNLQEESYSNKLNNTQDTTMIGQTECMEKIDVKDTNKKKLKSKQRNDMRNIHENVTHSQYDDLSDDEEGNFSNIMNYLKSYVDHENNFETKKAKSKPPVKSGTNKLSSNNKLDFDSSDSSDSSINKYTAQFNKAHHDHNTKNISVDKKKGYCKLSKKEIDFMKKQNQVSKNINSKTSTKNNTNKNDEKLESPIKNVNSRHHIHQNCLTANEYTAQIDEAHHDHSTKNISVDKKKGYCKLLSKKEIDFTKKQNQVSKSINSKTSRKNNANKNDDKLESPIKNLNSHHHSHQNWFTANGLQAESSQSSAEDKMPKINNNESKSLKTKTFKITKEKHTPTKCSKNEHDSINKSNEVEDGISSELAEFGTNKGNATVIKQFSENEIRKSDSKKPCTVLKSEKTQKNGKRLILDYFDRVLTERYENRPVPTNAEFILDSDGSSNGIKDGISDFETDKGSDSEECKNKILKIISYADDDLLTIFEENEVHSLFFQFFHSVFFSNFSY